MSFSDIPETTGWNSHNTGGYTHIFFTHPWGCWIRLNISDMPKIVLWAYPMQIRCPGFFADSNDGRTFQSLQLIPTKSFNWVTCKAFLYIFKIFILKFVDAMTSPGIIVYRISISIHWYNVLIQNGRYFAFDVLWCMFLKKQTCLNSNSNFNDRFSRGSNRKSSLDYVMALCRICTSGNLVQRFIPHKDIGFIIYQHFMQCSPTWLLLIDAGSICFPVAPFTNMV